ncbi:T9SS type A sorting domain-containing protein [Flavobacterium arcticum]|nr:T9SS type A sorting domain-containing protein [Flavobacterium arcticum]KAF2508963.1 T9SS type A sorting domain-containing protein [Flavobacterium arcticum]
MKNLTLLFSAFLAFSYSAFSQCEGVALPYFENAESATAPQLPDCMVSGYFTFASTEIFETTATPIEGFSGNALLYNTEIVAEGIPEDAGTGVTLGIPSIAFSAGTSYTVSYKYGMSNPDGVMGLVRIMLVRGGEYTYLPEQNNVAAGNPSTFISAPFTVAESDSYYFAIEIHLAGGQGYLYLDDITIEETATAAVKENTFSRLTVYPNPVKNEINLANANDVDNLELYTVTGQKVLSQQVTSSDVKINTEAFSAGIYFLKVTAGAAQKTIKIIKE